MIDSIHERARLGKPLDDVLIIDCHSHIGAYCHFHAPCNDAEGMLASMDALGVNTVMITAHASIGPDYIYGNDLVIDAVQRYPDRFWGYVTVNPHYPADMRHEIDRCMTIPGMKGIKLHPSCHSVPIDYENYRPAYEYANERRLPILIHTWGSGQILTVDKLAGQYPQAKFIMGHSGGDVLAMEEAIKVVNRHENVYGDLALSMVREGNVEWLLEKMGPDKVLYASDMPFFDPRPAFGRVALSRLNEQQKADVFGLNLIRLLNK